MKNRDFSLDAYGLLLDALRIRDYTSFTFNEVMREAEGLGDRYVVLRHDVDRLPWNSVATARLEAEKGMVASYFFRVVPGAWDPDAIREIEKCGHECGYHYEDMDLAKGNVDEAYRLFKKHLAELRQIVPVSTVCMHGSPLSKWDNRDIWKKYSYIECDIVGEPYFDLDFNDVFYITDTGRSWNAADVSIRDKVTSGFSIEIRSTFEFAEKIRQGRMPDRMMINTHPQRWSPELIPWLKELFGQNVKNVVKRGLVVAKAREVAENHEDSQGRQGDLMRRFRGGR